MPVQPPPSGHRILPLATLAASGRIHLEPQLVQLQGVLPAHDVETTFQQALKIGRALLVIGKKHATVYVHAREIPPVGANPRITTHPAHTESEPVFLLHVHRLNLLEQFPVLATIPPVSFRTDRGAGSFLYAFISVFADGTLESVSKQTRDRLRRHLSELIVTTTLDALHVEASVAGRRRHRQQIIRDYIEGRLSDANLSPQVIAAAFGISPRALYLLFDGEPGAVSGWILNRRLEKIHQDLTDPTYDDLSIATVAARHGFRNAAHLSRRFKQKFGLSPRDARQRAEKRVGERH